MVAAAHVVRLGDRPAAVDLAAECRLDCRDGVFVIVIAFSDGPLRVAARKNVERRRVGGQDTL